MADISGPGAIGPGQGPKGPEKAGGQSFQQTWKKWLGPGASKQEVQKFFSTWVRMQVTQIKHQEALAKKSSQKMKDVIEGKQDNG